MPTGQSKSSASGAITAQQREITVDPPSIGAATSVTFTIAFPGAQVGDIVSIAPRAALNAGLGIAYARVSAADTITCAILNATAGAIDPASATWDVRVERVAPT